MKLLAVEDSMTARLIVKQCFQPLGHTVVEAEDGNKALEALASEGDVDIVVLDWNMPEMGGFTCLTEIRKNSSYKDIKVIMCTTEAEKNQIVKAIKGGAKGYLLKPVMPDKLKEGVMKALGVAAS